MPKRTPSKPVAAARGKVAALSRSRDDTDPEFIAARQNLKTLTLQEHIARTVASWPPLTPEQTARIATILRGGGA